MLKRSATARILFAPPLALTLAWALLGAAQTNPFAPLRAGQLTGMKVEDSDGQKVGTIHNLILDTGTGQLKYVVIGSGGFLGVHSTLKLAPSQSMSAATTKRDTLAVNVTHGKWDHAPVFKTSHLASLAEPNRAREISSYFASPARESSAAERLLPTTGSDTGQETNVPVRRLKFASDLIGMRVVSRKQEKVGEVLDLLVAFGPPRPVFAIVSSGKLLRRGHQYAIPLSALSESESPGKLTLNADATALQQARAFNPQIWNSRNTNDLSEIFQYSRADD